MLLVGLCQSYLFGQTYRIYLNGSYYNDNDNVYVPCSSTGYNAQIQYYSQGNWYAATHLNMDAIPSGWSYQLQPSNNYTKTSVDLSQNYPTTNGQLTITWTTPAASGTSQFHLNLFATPQLYFTSTPSISGSYSSATYSVYAATSGNVNWTGYGGVQINGSGNYCCGQSATVSTQAYGGLVQVTATNSCGTSPAISVGVGTPYIANTTVNGSNGSSATVSWVASLALLTNGTASGANWVVTNGSGSISPSGTSCNAYPSSFLRVVGTATNSNGSGQDATFYIWKDGYSGYRMAYPNPAKDQVTLEFEDAQIAQDLLTSLALLDEKGKSWRDFDVSSAKTKNYFQQNKSITFDVKGMPKGTYYLHIALGEKRSSEVS